MPATRALDNVDHPPSPAPDKAAKHGIDVKLRRASFVALASAPAIWLSWPLVMPIAPIPVAPAVATTAACGSVVVGIVLLVGSSITASRRTHDIEKPTSG